MRRFEFVQGSSSKFWEIGVEGARVTTRWGRIGTDGQSKAATLGSPALASAAADKQIREKVAKGYTETAGAKAKKPAAKATAARPAPASAASKSEPAEYAKQRKKILDLVEANGLSAHRAAIEALIKPGIGLKTRKATKKDAAVGASRVGGEPDAPVDFEWPEGDEGPLLFVLQVNLEDVAKYDLEELLPKSGLLSLFSDLFTDHVTVFHFAKGTKLERQDWVPEEDEAFTERGVDVQPELHLPPHSSRFVGVGRGVLSLTGTEHEAYWDDVWLVWHKKLRPSGGGIHQLLGYANGDDSGDQATDEEVLFGFDSDDGANMNWGDAQCVWALMKRKHLQKGAWDKLRAVT